MGRLLGWRKEFLRWFEARRLNTLADGQAPRMVPLPKVEVSTGFVSIPSLMGRLLGLSFPCYMFFLANVSQYPR